MRVSPTVGVGITLLVPAAAALLLWRLRDITPWALPSLWFILGVRLVVLGLHLAWVWQVR